MHKRHPMSNPTQLPPSSMRSPCACLCTFLKRFGWLLTVVVLCCVSCTTEKKGIWDVVYRERIQDDYEVFLLRNGSSVQFWTEYKGEPDCQTEIDPTCTRTALSSYRFGNDEEVALLCDGGKVVYSRWQGLSQGTNTLFLVDRDGDGYPETRCIWMPEGKIVREELVPQVISSETASGAVPKNENLELP